LKKGKNMVNFDTSLDTSVIAASTTNYLDYIIIKVPTYVFSALGLKIGTWSARVMPREPISIHQLFEGNPCFSTASVRLYDEKPWHVAYNASTLVGSSGAPILDARNCIIGIHLESDAVQKCNVGVIPPVFRNSKKESPTNEDLMQHERYIYEYGLYEDGDDEYEKAVTQDYIDELEERYYTFAKQMRKEQSSGNWAEDMDALDELVDSFLEEEPEGFEAPRGTGTRGFEVSRLIERRSKPVARVYSDRFSKESPWTCGYCATVNTKLTHYCISCHKGFKRIKDKSDIKALAKEQAHAILENVQVPYPVAEAVAKQLEAASMDKEVATIVARSLASGFVAKTDLKVLSEACGLPEVNVDKNLIQQRMCANNCHVNCRNQGKKKYKWHLLPCVCTEDGSCPYENIRPYSYQFWHSSGCNPEYIVDDFGETTERRYKADPIKVVDQSGEKFLTVEGIEKRYNIPKAMEDLGVPFKTYHYVNKPIVKLNPVKATKPETIPEVDEEEIESSFNKKEKGLSDRTKKEIPPTAPVKRVRHRKRKHKPNKETEITAEKPHVTFNETPNVSLNSIAPAQTGALHTNGQNPSTSQNNQSKSGNLPVASTPANQTRSQKSGKVSSQRNQSMISMAGQIGQQKLKN